MATTADTYGSMTVMTVEPAFTGAEADAFRRVADEQLRAGGRWFVLDLARAGTFDSRGLEELLAFQEKVASNGGVVKLAGLKGHCRKIFEMTRFDKKFEVFEGVHEAVRNFD